MKTTELVNKELNEINREITNNHDLTQAQEKKMRKQAIFIKSTLKYLETNPSEAFVISEKERVSKILSSKTSKYGYWLKNVANYQKEIGADKKAEKPFKAEFNKENNLSTLRKQLKVLTYLAS